MKLFPVKVLVPLLLIFAIGFMHSCHKKSMPVITGRTTEPIAANTLPSVTTADTIAGKNIFTARCGRCHGLPDISSYNTKKWDIILSSMIPKARLNKDQGIHLTAYIKSNCNE